MARGAKFLRLYKRGGHRVLINKLGDLIVRPSAMEASIRLVPCSGSVQQHLLTSYLQSLLAVLLAQFSHKKLKGGMTGVVHLAQNSVPLKVCLFREARESQPDLETQGCVEFETSGFCSEYCAVMLYQGRCTLCVSRAIELPFPCRDCCLRRLI